MYKTMLLALVDVDDVTEGRDNVDVDASEIESMHTRRGRTSFGRTLSLNYQLEAKHTHL